MLRVCALLLPFFSLYLLLVAGEWRVASQLQRMCEEGRLCTSSNATWSTHTTYDKEEACAALAGRGLRNLTFAGVSQLFSCMALHLGARSKPAPSWLAKPHSPVLAETFELMQLSARASPKGAGSAPSYVREL